MSKLWSFHGGLRLEGHKHPSCDVPIAPASIPPYLILPLQQHAGIPATPRVVVGDEILKGQVIAHCADASCSQPGSVPLHAPTSGRVVALEERPVPHPSGLSALCVVVESDGEDAWVEREPISDCLRLNPDELRWRIAKAGIVGLGGAGFPSHLKLLTHNIETLILNGAECEPYITCDDRLMRERPDEVVIGGKILAHLLGGVRHGVIALEDNKPEALQALREYLARPETRGLLGDFELRAVSVPTLYPMGGERQLIRVLTGQELAAGRIPSQLGIVMHNVETAAKICRAVKYGEPLLSRIVTVTGDAVARPQNLEVLLGTPVRHLLQQCGLKTEPVRLVMGGPMMGIPLASAELPVVKTMNCVIASAAVAPTPPPLPCIRCGACEQVCPANLLPQQLYWHARAKDLDKLETHHIFDCIECGCCAYVCPSHLPLVHYYRYAKTEIRERRRERERAEMARERHEFRSLRLERDKAERKAKHNQMRQELTQQDQASGETDQKKAAIQAALERVKAKQQAQRAETAAPPPEPPATTTDS